jgi:thiol-disulfide isomerase/thioredoxin
MSSYVRILLAALLAVGLSAPGYAQGESIWERTAQERGGAKAEIEPHPDWDTYGFDLPVLEGSGRLSFEELATDGQPFVVFFWLADCPLCHLQMPYIERLKRDTEEAGVPLRIVGINVDMRKSEAEAYLAEHELGFTMLFDGNANRTDRAYEVSEVGCPSTFVFDGQGRYVDYIEGFKSNVGTAVLDMLGLKLPESE